MQILTILRYLISVLGVQMAEGQEKQERVKQDYTDDPTCCICLEEKVQEVLLPCGHSFCCECLMQLFQDDPICCPLCRKVALYLRPPSQPRVMDYNLWCQEWRTVGHYKRIMFKALQFIAISPFLSILLLRICQVLFGIGYIILFIVEPILPYSLTQYLHTL